MIKRIGSLLLALALLAGAGAWGPPRVAAASDGACPGTTGVTVVVDFHQLGGIVVRCAKGTPANGFDALAKAGFTVVQPSSMPGFTCRIDGLPGPDREACVNTPPANDYWSYWNAAAGGTWKYSQAGPASRVPAPGTVEGWSWAEISAGSGAPPPGISPPSVPAPTATPRPTPRPTPKPTPRPTPKPSATATPRATPTPTPARTAAAQPGAPATPSPTATAAAPTDAAAPTAPAASEAASATPDATPTAAAGSTMPSPATGAVADPTDQLRADGTAAPGEPTGADLAAASPGTPEGTVAGIALLVLVLVFGSGIRSRRRRT